MYEEYIQILIQLEHTLSPQIDNENSKKMKANLERIGADFEQMRKENQQLTKRLKAIS